jgi:hypothetical protein
MTHSRLDGRVALCALRLTVLDLSSAVTPRACRGWYEARRCPCAMVALNFWSAGAPSSGQSLAFEVLSCATQPPTCRICSAWAAWFGRANVGLHSVFDTWWETLLNSGCLRARAARR